MTVPLPGDRENEEECSPLSSIDNVKSALRDVGYFAERRLATAVFLAANLRRPLLLEGAPGVGKTELAKSLAAALGRRLIRLQCYEGLEQRQAAYEWNYSAQLLHARAMEATGGSIADVEKSFYDPRFLLERPLLQTLRAQPPGAVLLIDEVDRADEPFEAFLLEYLGEYQLTIPEFGVVSTAIAPITILTGNRTRDLGDALKRRCLYQWIEFPPYEQEVEIILSRALSVKEGLARQVARFVSLLRARGEDIDFNRLPGVAEAVEWAQSLHLMGIEKLSAAAVSDTSGVLFKDPHDIAALSTNQVETLIRETESTGV